MKPSACCAFQRLAAMPQGDAWLGPQERRFLAGLRVPQRRRDWCLGRWAAKVALRGADLTEIGTASAAELQILASADGSPVVHLRGEPVTIPVSLSHRHGAALCVVAAEGRVGCDLEWLEPRSAGFVADYFDLAEQRWIGAEGDPDLRSSALWSAKESLLKLLGVGLRIDTRELSVSATDPPEAGSWGRFAIVYRREGLQLSGWWLRREGWIASVVTDPASAEPRWTDYTGDEEG